MRIIWNLLLFWFSLIQTLPFFNYFYTAGHNLPGNFRMCLWKRIDKNTALIPNLIIDFINSF